MRRNLILGILAVVVLLVCTGAWYLQSAHEQPAKSLQEVSFCATPGLPASLVWIAADKGYFAGHGLNVTLRFYPSGAAATGDLLAGRLDFIMTPDYTVAQQLLSSGSLRILGSIDQTDNHYIIARRDRGINSIPDLEGKRIARSSKSFSEYLLVRFFVMNGLSMDNVTIIDLQPPETAAALERGEIDAAILQQPYPYQIQQKLDGNVTVWAANLGQPSYYLVFCNETTLRAHPGTIDALIASLIDAESFVLSHNDEAKKIAQQHVQYDDAFMDSEWPKQKLSVDLHQSVITSMEDETRWMIRNNITRVNATPDFRTYLYPDSLKKMKPSSVTVIM